MHIAAWHRRTPESKFTKFGEEMSIGQTPNHAKFCGDLTRSVRDIRDRKFVLPENVGQISPKSLKTCYPLRTAIMPNFIEIKPAWRKALQDFLHPSIFWFPRGTP